MYQPSTRRGRQPGAAVRATVAVLLAGALSTTGATLTGAAPATAAGAADGDISRISVSSTGVQGNGESLLTWISADGRYVAFTSEASNLVPDDTNAVADAFVRDRLAGTTTRVTVSSTGAQANGGSFVTSMTPDGRYVAFQSDASNLVPGDTNRSGEAFVRDLRTGVTSRVSLTNGGRQGNESSSWAVLSADGRYVAFLAFASNLVPGDTNQVEDIFVRDRHAGTTRRVSVSTAGAQADDYSNNPVISGDGRFVAFITGASTLVRGDTNGETDAFVRDLHTGTTTRISTSSGGVQSNDHTDDVAISADGRYLAFDSIASNLVPGDANAGQDVFVRDQHTGTTSQVSVSTGGAPGDGGSGEPVISPDGRFVAFFSASANLAPGPTADRDQLFIRDRTAATTTRVSLAPGGTTPDGPSYQAAISRDAQTVSFSSRASNLVPGDTNDTWDVFVRSQALGRTANP